MLWTLSDIALLVHVYLYACVCVDTNRTTLSVQYGRFSNAGIGLVSYL